jgi:uncharacterized protein YcsI (UPF0317 family)
MDELPARRRRKSRLDVRRMALAIGCSFCFEAAMQLNKNEELN